MQTSDLKQTTVKIEENLKRKYLKEVRPKLKNSLGKKNIYEVPAIKKIVVNVGFGKINPDQKQKEQIIKRLTNITGQKPAFTKAKKDIAGFKIRKGQVIGAKITLRRLKMNHFFEKIISIVLPRLRDFRGMDEKSFDGRGNYSIGFSEINVFPEIEYTKGEKPIGFEIVISTTASNDQEAKALLSELGMPFKDLESKKRKE